MASFDARSKAMTEYLQMEVGKDTRKDIEYSGYIKAVMDLLLINLDDIAPSN